MALHVLGVRHHSPACARRVEAALRKIRPRHILIEGPADFNERLCELTEPWRGLEDPGVRQAHRLPLSLFTWYRSEERTFSSWTPFCRHSPEWVALSQGKELGAQVRFFDLPAWSRAFVGVRNRYSDHPDRAEDYQRRLCEKVGVDDLDSLWDHLFEQQEEEGLGESLDTYFRNLRGQTEAGPRDAPREAYMARCVAWALREAVQAGGGEVVVVCGGWHQPSLEGVVAGEEAEFPEVPAPEDSSATYGTYLVPYSFRRLDSFVGYEAGMPSPAWYDLCWTEGPERAADQLLQRLVRRLRERKKQNVSTADLIACHSAAQALARLRGHRRLGRTDLLDGIAISLVKGALDQPLPWSRRARLSAGVEPLLVEAVRVFSGDQEGELAPGTPRPPLVHEVEEQLRSSDLYPTRQPRSLFLDLARPDDRRKSRLLHRLRVLRISGYTRQSGPNSAIDEVLKESWEIRRHERMDSDLIEAAAWGGSLETAAARCLEESMLGAGGLREKARLLEEAVFVGVETLTTRVLGEVAAGVHAEPDFAVVGAALEATLGAWRHGELLGAAGTTQLGVVVEACYDRGLWLLEGLVGPEEPASEELLEAIANLRDAARFSSGRYGAGLNLPAARAEGVMQRRAVDPHAPPAVRGAALGYLWSTGGWVDPAEAVVHATNAVRAAARPQTTGDFLAGLFRLAREEVGASPSLIQVIDGLVQELILDDYLIALPALRMAFGYFPPMERRRLAEQIVALHGGQPAEARTLMKLDVSPNEVLRGAQLDRSITARAARFGLQDGEEA